VIAAPPSSSDETRTAKNKFQIEYFRSFSLLVHCKSQISIRFCAIQAKTTAQRHSGRPQHRQSARLHTLNA
jgi:hypothetical protein